jgi:hypothetical protein
MVESAVNVVVGNCAAQALRHVTELEVRLVGAFGLDVSA